MAPDLLEHPGIGRRQRLAGYGRILPQDVTKDRQARLVTGACQSQGRVALQHGADPLYQPRVDLPDTAQPPSRPPAATPAEGNLERSIASVVAQPTSCVLCQKNHQSTS
jgi:hypothetical protein